MLIKKCVKLGLVLILFVAANLCGDDSVKLPQVSGNLQFMAYYKQDTSDVRYQLAFRRARLVFRGTVIPGKVGYFMQLEGANEAKLLDAKLIFRPFKNSELLIGRFMPKFTHYMPRSSKALDFVEYPLLTQRYGMWRQLGAQLSVGRHGHYRIHTGIFTGYPPNNWKDSNSAKSLLLSACAHPVEGLDLMGYSWFDNLLGKGENDSTLTRYGLYAGFAKSLTDNLMLRLDGELATGVDKLIDGSERKSRGFYLQGGFVFNGKIDLLVRFDQFDPNIDEENDRESKVMFGLNYHLLGDDVVFYLDYIHNKTEVAPNESEPKDDKIVLQIQLGF